MQRVISPNNQSNHTMNTQQPNPGDDDYSASKTLIHFPSPLPLLRHPIKSTPTSIGPYILAYKTQQSWAQSYLSCKAQLISQCQSGARIGCSISASNKCKLSWWEVIIGKRVDLNERAKCEEVCMNECFDLAKEKCVGFAKGKCEKGFKAARVGDVRGWELLGEDGDIEEYLRKGGWDSDC